MDCPQLHASETAIRLERGPKQVYGYPLYLNPTLHRIHHVAPYLARRLSEMGVKAFHIDDPQAARLLTQATSIPHSPDGADIQDLLQEAYYNLVADRILATAATADAIAVPCDDRPLAQAITRRAREAAPDLAIAAGYIHTPCQDADSQHQYTGKYHSCIPLPLGPLSHAALEAALETEAIHVVALLPDTACP